MYLLYMDKQNHAQYSQAKTFKIVHMQTLK